MMGSNVSGAEFGDIGRAYGQGYVYPDQSTLDPLNSNGLKQVRLPFRWERIQPVLGQPLDPDELARMKSFVALAAARGMSVILDNHNYGEYQTSTGKFHVGENAAVTIASFQDFWSRMATAFKGVAGVGGYDIMNEPQGFSNPNGRTWFTAAQAAVNGIRSVDTATTIYVEGDCWAGAHSWASCNAGLKISDPSNNFIFEAHQYFDADSSGTYTNSYDADGVTPTTGVDRISGFVAWLKANNARGMIGEYGIPNDDPRWLVTLDNMLSYMQSNCLGGTYWSSGPWWGDYKLSIEPMNGQARPQMSILSKYGGVHTCQ